MASLPMYCVALAVLFVGMAQATPTTNFDKFFPFWNPMLQDILRYNCSTEYAEYKTGEREPDSPLSSLVTPVINCILETMSESKKAELGASSVILGLLPTILQTLGSTPAETALLALRRPVLATLLALGSPSVATMRTSEFMETIANLVEKGDTRPTTIHTSRWRHMRSWGTRVAMSMAEYLVTAVAVANVVYLSYQLGFNAVVMFAPETIFMVPLWTFICIIIHLGGVLILYLKLHIDHKAPTTSNHRGQLRSTGIYSSVDSLQQQQQQQQQQLYSFTTPDPASQVIVGGGRGGGVLRRRTTKLESEFTPSAFHEPTRLRWRRNTIFVNLLIWLLSIGTLVNLVLGSMIFSSLLFFSPRDVLLIVTRYFVSTLVCRAIVRIELSGMKACTYYEPMDENEGEDDGEEHERLHGGSGVGGGGGGTPYEMMPPKGVRARYSQAISG